MLRYAVGVAAGGWEKLNSFDRSLLLYLQEPLTARSQATSTHATSACRERLIHVLRTEYLKL